MPCHPARRFLLTRRKERKWGESPVSGATGSHAVGKWSEPSVLFNPGLGVPRGVGIQETVVEFSGSSTRDVMCVAAEFRKMKDGTGEARERR